MSHETHKDTTSPATVPAIEGEDRIGTLPELRPVLLLGAGKLGAAVARALRRLQPGLPITLAARDLGRTEALARELGDAQITRVQLDREDLGLPRNGSFSAVVACLKDHALNSMRSAQDRGIPYFALSEAVFEISAHTAQYIHRPAAAPIVLAGHSIGSVPTLAAFYFARDFATVEEIGIGLVFDPDDASGPMTLEDMARIASIAPSPLIRGEGRWQWVKPEVAVRTFQSSGGIHREGRAAALLDTVSLAAAIDVKSIRVDLAEGPTATSLRGEGPSHEIIIDIRGQGRSGQPQWHRHELVDSAGYAAMSGRAIAVCVERAIGLSGGAPIAPGLYTPEVFVDPEYLMRKLREFGTRITSSSGSP